MVAYVKKNLYPLVKQKLLKMHAFPAVPSLTAQGPQTGGVMFLDLNVGLNTIKK